MDNQPVETEVKEKKRGRKRKADIQYNTVGAFDNILILFTYCVKTFQITEKGFEIF